MFASFLITFREVIEASLIVATMLGILKKLDQVHGVKTVWYATFAAFLSSVALLVFGGLVGVSVQALFEAQEALIEGIIMLVSAVFITWAVFFLHNYFGRYKTKLLQTIRTTIEKEEQKGLFILAFTAVFREGFEIVLFLSTIFFSSSVGSVLTGFTAGTIAGLLVAFGLFTATFRLPLYYAFRTTSILLILFAGGLLARGVHEFSEIGIVPETGIVTLAFVADAESLLGDFTKAIFGITKHMDYMQLAFYALYVLSMSWWVFFRSKAKKGLAK